MKSMEDVGRHVLMMIKLQTWKRRKRKTKWLKTEVYLIRTFCFATQDAKWV